MGGPDSDQGGKDDIKDVAAQHEEGDVSQASEQAETPAQQPDEQKGPAEATEEAETEPTLRLTVDRPCKTQQGFYISLSAVQRKK